MSTRSAREAHAKTVRLEAVATKTATHEEYRAKVRAEGRPDPGPWSTYAADLDARTMHYGIPGHPSTRRQFAGHYTEQEFQAAAKALQARNKAIDAELKAAPPMTRAQREHVAGWPGVAAVKVPAFDEHGRILFTG